jgi:riboflavin biosynthesis pyrimidine reductase
VIKRLYGGGFGFSAPLVYANFVQSIDGVVALRSVRSPAPLISGHSAADRFVMAMLRACADGVLVGAGTMRDTAERWTPDAIFPELSSDLATLRVALGMDPEPRLILLTASGDINIDHPALHAGASVLTTAAGARRLGPYLPPASELHVLPGDQSINLSEAVELVRSQGLRYILSEAGPTITAQLVQEGLLDELFLTIAPIMAGGGRGDGLSLLEGIRILPDRREERQLVSLRRHGSYLFLRYGPPSEAGDQSA